MRHLWAGLVVLAASAPCAAEKDPIEAVREAIQATRDSGGWECEGAVKGGQGGMTVMIDGHGGGGRPVEGAMTCRMDGEGDVEIRVEAGEDAIGVTRVGDDVRKTATWSGEARDVDAFSKAALRLLTWKELRAAVKKGKKARIEPHGDVDVVTMTLPGKTLESRATGLKKGVAQAQAIMEGEFLQTTGIEARFEIDRKTGRLAAMTFEVLRSYSDMVLRQIDEQLGEKDGYGEWGDEGEGEEKPRSGAAREALKAAGTKVTYEFRGFRYDERITVESPK